MIRNDVLAKGWWSMPRNDDKLYLTDMVIAADDIAEFIAGYFRETFLSDKVTQSAVIQKIITIGKAANAVSAEVEAKYPAVDWSGVIKMDNRVTLWLSDHQPTHCLGRSYAGYPYPPRPN